MKQLVKYEKVLKMSRELNLDIAQLKMDKSLKPTKQRINRLFSFSWLDVFESSTK